MGFHFSLAAYFNAAAFFKARSSAFCGYAACRARTFAMAGSFATASAVWVAASASTTRFLQAADHSVVVRERSLALYGYSASALWSNSFEKAAVISPPGRMACEIARAEAPAEDTSTAWAPGCPVTKESTIAW